MRRTAIGILVASVLGAAGCGSGTQFANKPRPPVPVDLSVYIDNGRVSVSPTSVGAGPIIFIVTNQARRTESLTIAPAGTGSSPLASTGPINPQATAQVTVNLSSPGDYKVATAAPGPGGRRTDAQLATQVQAQAQSGIRSAALHIGPARENGSSALLQP